MAQLASSKEVLRFTAKTKDGKRIPLSASSEKAAKAHAKAAKLTDLKAVK
jgi:hypothetical protein